VIVGFAIALSTPALGAQPAVAAPVASLDSAWSSIARAYYDTALVNGRWRVVFDSLRRGAESGSEDDVRAAIRALISVPGQSHFALIPAGAAPLPTAPKRTERPGTSGMDLRTIGDAVIVWRVEPGSPAARAGIRAGSRITRVDTIPTDSVIARLARAFGGEVRQVRLLAAAYTKSQLSGAEGDTVRLTYQAPRARRGTSVALALQAIEGRSTQFGNLPPMVVRATRDSVSVRTARGPQWIPLVAFNAWMPAVMQELDIALFASRGAPGMILDLRGNPGGVVGMISGVSGHFTDSALALGTMYGRGAMIITRANPRLVNAAGTRVGVYEGPLAVIVDEFTASTSEFFAAGLQAVGRARVFGVRSAGQALPSLMLRLPNGDVLMHPIADHVDAAGRRVEGDGVTPDEITPLTVRDLVAGRDAALDAARAWLARTLP
jgi:carboxyl-terminal processing protease